MSNKPGILRANMGCILRVGVAGVVLSILGCAGMCAGTYSAFFAGIYAPPEAPDRPLVIRGGTLYDGVADKPSKGMLVLIEGDRITCVGTDCGVPAHAQVLDTTNLFIAPGLVDLHVHMGAFADDDANQSVPGAIWSTLRHRPQQRRDFLEAGVTTVRSLGDDPMALGNQRIWLEDGTILGPRLLMAGPAFTAPGGHPANMLAESPWISSAGVLEIDDPDRARTRVQELADRGVDGIKAIYDDVGGRLPKLELEVLRAIGEEAKARDLWFAVHVGSDADIVDAVSAGATSIEHIARDPISQDAIEAMLDADVTLVPTLAVTQSVLPPEFFERVVANTLQAHQAGVRIGVGSDTQGETMAFGESTIREIQLLIGTGLTPVEALKAATANGGLALNDHVGVLAKDARADLVAFYGDPTQDKTALDRPVLVIHDGVVVLDKR